MSKKIILLLLLVLNINILAEWNVIFRDTTIILNKVHFLGEKGMVASNKGFILISTNGGSSWIQKIIAPSNYNIYSVFIFNENIGYAGTINNMYKTLDFGNNWFTQSTPSSRIFDIHFINEYTGFASTYQSIIKTTNGGYPWFIMNVVPPLPIMLELYSIDAIDSMNAVTGGDCGISCEKNIRWTTNGGINWSNTFSNYPAIVYGIDMYSKNHIFYASMSGIIGYSTDMGYHWSVKYLASSALQDVQCIDSLNIVAAGNNGKIFRTTDGGTTWTYQPTGTNITIQSIHFININTGYAVGSQGTILKTTNGGNPIGIGQNNNKHPNMFILHQNYPNPFNPNTTIEFDIKIISNVIITVYDALGKAVDKLTNGKFKPGKYGVTFSGNNYPSGVYFYTLKVNDKIIDSKKMILSK